MFVVLSRPLAGLRNLCQGFFTGDCHRAWRRRLGRRRRRIPAPRVVMTEAVAAAALAQPLAPPTGEGRRRGGDAVEVLAQPPAGTHLLRQSFAGGGRFFF